MTFESLIEWAPQIVKDKLEGLKSLRERPDYHPEKSAYLHTKIVTERLIKTGKPELILAGVFHDIFKAELAKINPKNGYPTSPGHDKAAAEFIRKHINQNGGDISFSFFFTKVCQEFGGDTHLVAKRTADICEQHMRIKEYSVMQKKKQKTFRDMDIFSDLLIFSEADDMLKEFNYPFNELFPTETHRNIYIALNSQRQIDWEKSLTYIHPTTGKSTPTLQALNPRSYVEAVEISIRQVEYDQKQGKLRYSIEEMFRYDMVELNAIQAGRHQEWVDKFLNNG